MSSSLRSGPLTPGIAFVTGGAGGLGNAIAVAFAREGARGVALVDVLDDAAFEAGKKKIEDIGAKCITIRADVTKEDEVERAVAKCVEEFGRLDYAANFAGVIGPLQPVAESDLAAFKRVLEINTVGVWLCCKYEMKQMMTQDSIEVEEGRVAQRGSIVNAASVNSIQAGAMTSAYTTSKHAVPGITKAAALEGRPHNIRVNAVSPGFLPTNLGQSVTNSPLGSGGLLESDLWKSFEARQGRRADPAEVGDAVVMMSTPRMSLLNGHNMVLDGGFTINQNNE